MIVRSLWSGNRVIGLYVGAGNAHRYFRRDTMQIELQLDHLRIFCSLAPAFWRNQPEIRDPRLSLWLESKKWREKVNRKEQLVMIPLGNNSFALRLISEDGRKGSRADAATTKIKHAMNSSSSGRNVTLANSTTGPADHSPSLDGAIPAADGSTSLRA